MKCPDCGEWFDMRDLDQLLAHVHDAEIRSEKVRGRRSAGSGKLSPLSHPASCFTTVKEIPAAGRFRQYSLRT
jgi:hypothetical protein